MITFPKHTIPGRLLFLCLMAAHTGIAPYLSAEEEPLLSFTYSVHSTLGLLTMEATVEVTAEEVKTAKFRVPNRGFSRPQRYQGDGSFAFRLIGDDGEPGPPVNLPASPEWNGRHVYFFAFGNRGGEVPIRLAPMPENPEFRGRGAVIFGNYSNTPIAAQLGPHRVRTQPGKIVWHPAVDAPDGMQTLIVKAGEDGLRPLYRNLIPVRPDHRLFIFILPGRDDRGERLLVVFDDSLRTRS